MTKATRVLLEHASGDCDGSPCVTDADSPPSSWFLASCLRDPFCGVGLFFSHCVAVVLNQTLEPSQAYFCSWILFVLSGVGDKEWYLPLPLPC